MRARETQNERKSEMRCFVIEETKIDTSSIYTGDSCTIRTSTVSVHDSRDEAEREVAFLSSLGRYARRTFTVENERRNSVVRKEWM